MSNLQLIKVEIPSPQSSQLMKLDIESTLDSLRELLAKEKLMTEDDFFWFGAECVQKKSEDTITLSEILTDQKSLVVGAKTAPSKKILYQFVFVNQPERDCSLELDNDTMLSDVRKLLATEKKLNQDEFFLNGTSKVLSSNEATLSIEKICGEDHKVQIEPLAKALEKKEFSFEKVSDKSKFPIMILGDTILTQVRVELGDRMDSNAQFVSLQGGRIEKTSECDWKLADIANPNNVVQFANPKDRLIAPEKKASKDRVKLNDVDLTTKFDAVSWGLEASDMPQDIADEYALKLGIASAEDVVQFACLPLNQVKMLFTALYLNRGLRFGSGDTPQQREIGARSTMAPVVYWNKSKRIDSASVPSSLEWETTATTNHILHEIREKCATVMNASAGYEGIALGGKFRYESEKLQKSETTTISLQDQLIVPKVTVEMNPQQDLVASLNFIKAVESVLNSKKSSLGRYEELHRQVFSRYGYYFPCEVTLGGKWLRKLTVTTQSKAELDSLLLEFSFSGSADVETGSGRVQGEIGVGHTQSSLEKNEHIKQLKKTSIQSIGGSTSLAISESSLAEWTKSLGCIGFWAVIGNKKLVPILDFLPIQLANACYSLIFEHAQSEVTARYTVLDMDVYSQRARSELAEDWL